MKPERGFTLVELLVVITIIGILAAIAIPNMTKARTKARETEVKANIHVIQEAIERYYVSEQEYPAYLIGGSENSWPIYWERKGLTPPPSVDPPYYDPLIEFNYLDQYPKNPFVDESKGAFYLEQSGGSTIVPASGDPRFGVKGTNMPNSVDDPLWWETGPDANDFADTVRWETGTSRIVNYGQYGGRPGGTGETAIYTIPGSFFYRAEGPIDMASSVLSGNPVRREFVYKRYSRFILGGFGHATTKGLDVLRLGGVGFYRHQPDTLVAFPWDIPLLLPEVFGGGGIDDAGNDVNPFFPYEPSEEGIEFYYGAPDGHNDGVVIVLTDVGENLNF